jgi:hypothetical protein
MMSDGPSARTAASPIQFPDSPLSRVIRQPLILGLFLPVQSGRVVGIAVAPDHRLELRL